ncbi:MAG: phage tail sheath family protein [Oscillospiraceae bacterium]|jgi:hypothetical protein|nr:phage tail sheath family protein [Oscillospiraceae bacterium]
MSGGTFDPLAGKTLPGTYINFESTRRDAIPISERGIVLLPLLNHSYGPEKTHITLTSASPDAEMARLGYSVYDPNPSMLLIREAFKNASTVIVYIPAEGKKATLTSGGVTGTAKYGGSRGNDLYFSIVDNPVGGFDVAIHLVNDVVAEYTGITTADELIALDNPWITFTGAGNLSAVAGAKLAGGEDGVPSNADITEFLDKSDNIRWNTLAFPVSPSGEDGDSVPALLEAVKTKITYLRDGTGTYRAAVVSGLDADYEGIINVTNGVKLSDGTVITPAQATAWVAGVDAAARNTKSNTYERYDGAADIVGVKSKEAAEAAVKRGEFFFTFDEEGYVVVQYDINSLTTFKKPKDETYRKNRVRRVFDTFGESVKLNFPPNRFDNSPTGWDVMEGLGRALLKQFEQAGAIKNVDYDNDFKVDRTGSTGDVAIISVGLEPVDSAEKLYFTIKTR